MYCPKCATQAVPGQRFCRNCGTNLGVILDAVEGKQRGPIDFETLKNDLRELGSNLRAGFEHLKGTNRLDKTPMPPPPPGGYAPGTFPPPQVYMADLAQDINKSIKHEIEREELRQVVTRHLARPPGGEVRGHAFGRDLRGDRGVELGLAADQRDVAAVALVAGARMRKPIERDHDAGHAASPTKVTRVATLSRSIRQDALASRGVRCRRTPPPPAGPAQ